MQFRSGEQKSRRAQAWSSLLVVVVLATGCSASTSTVTESAPTVAPATSQAEPTAPEPASEPTSIPATPVPATPVPATSVPDTASPTPEETAPLETESDLSWDFCLGGECATLTVPLDYDDPTGPTIDVAVVRTPALNSEERIGSLFVNFGGPGGETTSIFGGASAALGSVFERFDIVGWDPRGVGRTERLACDVLGTDFPVIEIDPSDGLEDEVAEQAAEFAPVVECATDSGPIIDHLGTVNVARDMEQVRLALGDEPMNYLGLSYGTQIGWVYASLFGESVRSMILDGAVPGGAISAEDFVVQLAGFQRTFDYFDDVCSREAECLQADEGFSAAVERIADELDQDPISLGDGSLFGEVEFRQALLFGMYQRPDFIGPRLTGWIDNADNGDANGMLQLLSAGAASGTPGAYQAVLCADGGDFPGADGPAADYQATLDASETFGTLGEIVRCDLWPGEVEAPPAVDSSAAPTILVVGNTFDPATPYESAVLLDQQLADSVLLTVEGGGHTAVLDNQCAGRIAADYVNDLVAPPVDTVCFTPGFFGVQLAQLADAPDELRITTVVADTGAEAGGVLIDDVLVSVDGALILDPSLIPAVRPGTPSTWIVIRDGEEVTLTVTPTLRPWN